MSDMDKVERNRLRTRIRKLERRMDKLEDLVETIRINLEKRLKSIEKELYRGNSSD